MPEPVNVNSPGVPGESSAGSGEAGDRFRKSNGAAWLGRPQAEDPRGSSSVERRMHYEIRFD